MSELDPNGVEAAATAIIGAEVGYEMKLSRLVDGVSTYTLKLETGEQFEFGNTDDVYEKIASEKAKRQAEAAITAYLSTVSPLSDGDGWQDISSAPRDDSRVILGNKFSPDPNYPIGARWNGHVWIKDDGFPAYEDGKLGSPTHWRPLPARPRDEVA